MQLLPLPDATVSAVSDAKERHFLPVRYQPKDIDIVCERGKAFANHPGNIKFSEAVRSNLQRYVEGRRRVDKIFCVAYVTSYLRQGGARFIKLDNKSKRYYEISEDQAHGKTGHAIRDLLKMKTQAKKRSKSVVASKNYSHGSVGLSKQSDLFKLRALSKKLEVVASKNYLNGAVGLSKQSDLFKLRALSRERSKMVVPSMTYSHGMLGSEESDPDSTTLMMGRGRGSGPLIRSLARSRNIFLFRSPSAW
jgi:hypothetical protein